MGILEFIDDMVVVKDKLKKWLTQNDVTIPDGTRLVELVDLLDGVQTGDGDEQLKGLIERTVTDFTWPGGLSKIGGYAFYGCTSLAADPLPDTVTYIDNYAFGGSVIAWESIPSGVTNIGVAAFQNCYKLALTEIPSGVTGIGVRAFANCTGLTSITFKGKPDGIGATAFSGCTNLATIRCPWYEGEVANAPWGATNATIIYDLHTYNVTSSLTNVTSSNTATTITEGNTYTAKLTAASGYTLGTVTVTMGGTDVTSTAWDGSDTISIGAVTGDIVITAAATKIATTFTINAPNTTLNASMESATAGSTRVWTADEGYKITSFVLNVNGTVDTATIDEDGNTTYTDGIKSRVTLTTAGVRWDSIKAEELQGTIIVTITTEAVSAVNSYTVATEDGASYGFTLDSDGWYVRENGGIGSSFAMSRITFNMATAAKVTFTFVNYAEASFDFGVLSNIDSTLTKAYATVNHNQDVSAGRVMFNGSRSTWHKSDEQTVTYDMPAGEHFVIAKYVKDNSGNINSDMFKFKVSIGG